MIAGRGENGEIRGQSHQEAGDIKFIGLEMPF
jgi:hypothetical protein